MTAQDEGMTLIEVLITMAVMGFVFAAVAGSFVIGMQVTADSDDRLGGSVDVQVVTTVFARDAASAAAVTETGSCGSGGTPLATLTWTDEGTPRSVTYRTTTGADGAELHRHDCADLANPVLLARRLVAEPDLSCTPSPCGTTVRRVRLVLTTTSGDIFTFTGSPRRTA